MRSVARAGLLVGTAAVATLVAALAGVERWFGDAGTPSVTFDVAIPYELTARGGGDEIERAWRERLRDYRLRTGLAPFIDDQHIAVRVEVVGARAVDAPAVLRALVSSSRLEIRPVASGERVVETWMHAVDRLAFDVGDARVEVDSWTVPRTGATRHDAYLAGPSLASVQRAAALLSREHPLPAGVSLAYEHVIPRPGARASKPYHRSYLVRDEVILANDDIASASVSHDAPTLAPEVDVTLTDAARTRFGDATTRLVGEKLAILVDGAVKSAPIVLDSIRGGRVRIAMGGADPKQQEREARVLAAALASRPRLPAGLDARLVRSTSGSLLVIWPPRIAVGMLAAALAWLLARRLDQRRRRTARAATLPASPTAT